MATRPSPGLVFPALTPTPGSPQPPLLQTPSAGPGPCPPLQPPPAPGLLSYLHLSLPAQGQRRGLLSPAAPSLYCCLRRPLLVLREVPFVDVSLLGRVGLGPNSPKLFWDQGLAPLGTRRCVDRLPARAALSRVSGRALPAGRAVPTPCGVACCSLAVSLVPSFLLARVLGFQPRGGSPSLCRLALVETEEPRGPSIPAGVLWVSGGSRCPTSGAAPAWGAEPARGCCMSGPGLGCCAAPSPGPSGKIKICYACALCCLL